MKVSKLPDGTLTTRWLDSRTVELTFEGKVTQSIFEQVLRDFWDVAGDNVPLYAFLDTSKATGFSASIRGAATRFVYEFKGRGGREIVGICSIAAMRMFGQALTFAAGVPLKLYASRDQGLTYIISKIKENP